MGTSVEEIPSIKRRKIQQTVINILKDADWETATELSVRAAAAEQLREDFSDVAYKSFIRKVVESYLLSTVASSTLDASVSNGDAVANLLSNGSVESTPRNRRVICKLSDNINVAICEINGQTMVSIQEYHQNQIDGKQLQSGQGISLTDKQWSTLRNSFSAIDEAIAKMESHERSTASQKLHKANGVSPVDEIAHEEPVLAANQNHMKTGDLGCLDNVLPTQDVSNSFETSTFPIPEGQVANGTSLPCPHLSADKSLLLSSSQNLVPILTTRFNGKNYYCWKHQMEFFLKQLRVAYVLTLPCPSIPTARKNWIDDDYLCRHSILNSLADNLFNEYSKKNYIAKELWEQLKSEYDEDFGTKRSMVHRYVQFEIVDGVSVTEQVQELNHLVNTIVSSGTYVDENFHVSVIISKLPPSWTEFRRKLMHEEYILPLNALINRVKAEEQVKNAVLVASQKKDGSNQKNNEAVVVPMDTQEEHHHIHMLREEQPYNNNNTYNKFEKKQFQGKKGVSRSSDVICLTNHKTKSYGGQGERNKHGFGSASKDEGAAGAGSSPTNESLSKK